MRRTLPLLLCSALLLTGCASIQQSRLNPFNWFGGPIQPTAAPLDANGELRPLVPENAGATMTDTRVLIDQITSLRVNRTPDGVILTATGLAAAQGRFNAQLVPTGYDNGVLGFAFRVAVPEGATDVGRDATRRITVARVLTQAELQGVRTIRVQAARNAQTARR